MTMLYNKHNLAVAKIASKGEIKPELASVFFTKDKTCATDSFRLLEVSTPVGLDVADWPKVEGITAMRGCAPFMVNAKMLADKVKLPKKANLPILECAAVSHIEDGRFVEFITTDLETVNRNRVPKTDGKFPDYERLFPAGEPMAELTMDGAMMSELLKVMSDLSNRVVIRFYGKNKPVTLQCQTARQTARGLMMPMQS